MPRPARSVSSTPTSRERADSAADTDGCVTTRSSEAARTEPAWTTARNACSWVSVIAIYGATAATTWAFRAPSPPSATVAFAVTRW